MLESVRIIIIIKHQSSRLAWRMSLDQAETLRESNLDLMQALSVEKNISNSTKCVFCYSTVANACKDFQENKEHVVNITYTIFVRKCAKFFEECRDSVIAGSCGTLMAALYTQHGIKSRVFPG